jgi:hypothetical protein
MSKHYAGKPACSLGYRPNPFAIKGKTPQPQFLHPQKTSRLWSFGKTGSASEKRNF